VLEYLARLAAATEALDARARPAPRELLAKHYRRKHGPEAYYGQAR